MGYQKKGDSDDPVDKKQERADVEAFLKETPLDDISFDQWCNHNNSLDLKYPVFLTEAQAKTGCEKTIKLSRTIFYEEDGKNKKKRVKFSKVISIPRLDSDSLEMVFDRDGDEKEGCCGVLLVTVKVIK